MKQITYAGNAIETSDDVAFALIDLTACLAKKGTAEAITIPIVRDGAVTDADLVVGAGVDVLAVPSTSDGPEPDFSSSAAQLREAISRHEAPTAAHPSEPGEDLDYEIDFIQ